MQLRLDGQVAIVTGASRGIGRAIVERYVEAGASVLMVSRSSDDLSAAAAEIGPGVAVRAAHAGSAADGEACVGEALERWGRLDILVNNAATNPYAGPAIGVDEARLDKTQQVNVNGPLLWAQAAWRGWMAAHGGSILNIASIGGINVGGDIGVYDMTKAALIHLTRHLAVELGPSVRVNAIAPGLVRTRFAEHLWAGDRGALVEEQTPLGRLGDPGEIADAALFLTSSAASWITGHTLVVDGGQVLTGVR
jgi:NAD(P)-dependent dehydrogenase (short-subunit alcohol dehydrogenase family)